VGDYKNSKIYSTPISSSSTTYDATLLQSPLAIGGIAVSSDGYLYWSNDHGGGTNWVFRVPVASPTATPAVVGTGPGFNTPDGLAVSCDGTTVFVTFDSTSPGVWSIPTNQGLPQPATPLTALDIPLAIDIAIGPCVAPPKNFTGVQTKCDFGLVYEWCNILRWSFSSSKGILFYRIYRNGVEIATVNANTLSYKDHDRKKGVKAVYSIIAVTAYGFESVPISITVP
jgi:DNA-binding beta-propeller fold protein YncE